MAGEGDDAVLQGDAAVLERSSSEVVRDHETWNHDHEEKAREIAEGDLNRKNKQVKAFYKPSQSP